MITLIAAVGKNNELGKNNQLIWDIPGDLKFFREKTLHQIIVMGRKTFESIGRPLPKRENIVLTSQPIENVQTFQSIDKLLHDYQDKNLFIIGGESIYRSFIPLADVIYLTEIQAEDKEADTYFPTFDKTHYNKEVLSTHTENGITYQHCVYTRK